MIPLLSNTLMDIIYHFELANNNFLCSKRAHLIILQGRDSLFYLGECEMWKYVIKYGYLFYNNKSRFVSDGNPS